MLTAAVAALQRFSAQRVLSLQLGLLGYEDLPKAFVAALPRTLHHLTYSSGQVDGIPAAAFDVHHLTQLEVSLLRTSR